MSDDLIDWFIFVFIVIVSVVTTLLVHGIFASAAEATPPVIERGSYHFSLTAWEANSPTTSAYLRYYDIDYTTPYPVYAYKRQDGADKFLLGFYMVDENGKKITMTQLDNGVVINRFIREDYKPHDRESLIARNDYSTDYTRGRIGMVSPIYSDADFSISCPLFETEDALKNYIATGDTSGRIKGEDIPYDHQHDFSNDTYNSDMPVPELSKLHHNGFFVNNASEDLFIEIVVESKFYGAKHYEKIAAAVPTQGDIYNITADKSWLYASHYFNIADYSQIAVNDSKINIKDIWNIDNEGALIKDFESWSIEYPTHKKLPDYNFFKHSNSNYTLNFLSAHDFSETMTNRTPSQKLKASGQASTTFYVRFYDKKLNYGRWVYYTIQDGQSNVYGEQGEDNRDDIEVGNVGSDMEGNPAKQDPQKGKQDPITGDFTFPNYSSNNNIDATDLWNQIRGLINNMGDFPDLLAAVFSFLPSWLLYMIAAGIAASVILRIIGR